MDIIHTLYFITLLLYILDFILYILLLDCILIVTESLQYM